LATEAANYKNIPGKKIEWRIAGGKPFAVILRVSNYKKNMNNNEENQFQQKYKTGETLLVKGLKGFEQINFKIKINAVSNANAKARKMADMAYINNRK
jgi:hypothetical protein